MSAANLAETDLLGGLVRKGAKRFSPEVARAVLAELRFDAAAKREIGRLLRANQRGKLDAAGRARLDHYLRVGQVFDVLTAKARASLRDA